MILLGASAVGLGSSPVVDRDGNDTDVMARGVVKVFKSEKGWGAITCAELPDGQDVWVHYSDIEGPAYRSLEAGDIVDFDYEVAWQDSFNFRASRVRRVAPGPAPVLRRQGDHVVIAPEGTPDTPLTPRRHHPAGGDTTSSRTLASSPRPSGRPLLDSAITVMAVPSIDPRRTAIDIW